MPSQDRDNSVQVSFISVYRKLTPVLAIYPGLSVCNVDSLVTANKISKLKYLHLQWVWWQSKPTIKLFRDTMFITQIIKINRNPTTNSMHINAEKNSNAL